MTPSDTGSGPWWDTGELDSFDSTLANLAEVIFACLDAAGARSVVEVGAEYGLFTRELLAWGERSGAEKVIAVDPLPDRLLTELADKDPELELVVATSHEALAELDATDAVVIDGDHNYYTVSEELRLIGERAGTADLPLIFLHDVGWPHGRRDSYYAPERIPEAHRQPIYEGAFLVPDDPGVTDRGLFFERVAMREGGPANGVLTAAEDFVNAHGELELAIVPPFFGLGIVWPRRARWAGAVAAVVAPYDRNPLLERVERKRIDHLVAEFLNMQRLDRFRSAEYDMRYEAVGRLLPMHDSSAFAVGERLSRLRSRDAGPLVSRETLWRVITELARDDVRIDLMRGEG
jgi:hypothetical protein